MRLVTLTWDLLGDFCRWLKHAGDQAFTTLVFYHVLIENGKDRDDRDRQKNTWYARHLLPREHRQNYQNRVQVQAPSDDSRVCNVIVYNAKHDQKNKYIQCLPRIVRKTGGYRDDQAYSCGAEHRDKFEHTSEYPE